MQTERGYGGKVFIRFLTSLALLVLSLTPGLQGDDTGRQGRNGSFFWKESKDPSSGLTTWILGNDGAKGEPTVTVRLCPEAGANLYSYRFNDLELLRGPSELKASAMGGAGIPILYPTPNRVRGGRFTFEGRDYVFRDDGRNSIHGLVLRERWSSEPPVFDGKDPAGEVSVKAWIDFEPGSPLFDRFPIRHRLTVRYRLSAKGLRAEFTVANHDKVNLPFGLGIHPYFALLGAREQTLVRVQAEKKMEATQDLLPTGSLLPLDGAPFDLRQPRPLSELALDDVYWGMKPGKAAGYEARDVGIKLDLQASEDFTHMVVYTPQGRPFFCLENQTCSTDAHNLHARGLTAESHLLVVPAGGSWTGWIELQPSRMRNAE